MLFSELILKTMRLKMLSKRVMLRTLLQSATAERLMIREQYKPNTDIQRNLQALAMNILDPIMEKFPDSVITSGYRCARLNDAVGGARNSQHLRGQAADIWREDYPPLLEYCRQLDYDQLIDYGYYLHISFCLGKRRHQFISLPSPP